MGGRCPVGLRGVGVGAGCVVHGSSWAAGAPWLGGRGACVADRGPAGWVLGPMAAAGAPWVQLQASRTVAGGAGPMVDGSSWADRGPRATFQALIERGPWA